MLLPFDTMRMQPRAFAGRVLWYVLQRRGKLPMIELRDHVVSVSPWRAEIEPGALEKHTIETAMNRRHTLLAAAIAAVQNPMHTLGNLATLLSDRPFDPFDKPAEAPVYEACYDVLKNASGTVTDEDLDQLEHAMAAAMRAMNRDNVTLLMRAA